MNVYDGTITSPQVPTGNYRDLTEAVLLDEAVLSRNEDNLERVKACLDLKRYSKELDEHPAMGMWRLPDEPDIEVEGEDHGERLTHCLLAQRIRAMVDEGTPLRDAYREVMRMSV